MAYLCTMCIWCPERLEERVGSLGTKVTNGSKSLCGCWVLSKGNNCSFLLLLFLGTGFLYSFRPVLEATSALNHRPNATDLKIRISYWYLTSTQCSTSIFLIMCVHVRDSRERIWRHTQVHTWKSENNVRESARSRQVSGVSEGCTLQAGWPWSFQAREAASHLSLGVQGLWMLTNTSCFFILVLRIELR